MFDRIRALFGGSSSEAKPAGPQLAMPLFAEEGPVGAEAVVAKWAELFPDEPPLVASGHEGDVLEFTTGERSLMAVHVGVPVPDGEVVAAVESSWMWPRPVDPVRDHRSHAIVTTPVSGDGVADALGVTRLAAALLAAGPGVALYWGNSRQVHLAELAIDFAREEGLACVPLWVGITISADSPGGPFSAATHGLEALGHKEFEVLETRTDVGTLRTTLLDLAAYVLDSGPVLLDGQTFGPSAEVRWSVRHRASELVPGRSVIVLGIP